MNKIKQPTLDGLERYVQDRVPTGHFLAAVLSNDLRESIGYADDENLEALPQIVQHCYSNLPPACWGSREKVAAWLAAKPEPV